MACQAFFLLCLNIYLGGASVSLVRNSAAAESEGGQKFPARPCLPAGRQAGAGRPVGILSKMSSVFFSKHHWIYCFFWRTPYNKFNMAEMEQTKIEEQKTGGAYVKDLEKKATFLKELLSFVEDKALGFLMEKTEEEDNIPLSEAKNFCNNKNGGIFYASSP